MFTTLVLLSCTAATSHQNIINMVQGKVRGVPQDGYVSYNGIPYAAVDKLRRFKRAGLAPSWSGVREIQHHHCTPISEPEDCLILDVHVPVSATFPWPVLVWVTGGNGRYNPGKIVQKDVIVVVVHHRLGPEGFLCLGDVKAPGNAGVKDVVLALRWIRDNIVAFKGNSAQVVVGGQSFGAAMVEALMLSPMAKDLFHGAILQSGTVLCPWAFNYDAESRSNALLNNIIDKEGSTSLTDVTTVDLVSKAEKIDFSYFPLAVCLEKPFKNEERLFSEPPYDLLSDGKVKTVPLIMGYNSDEAYIFVSNLIQADVLKRASKEPSFLLPEELKLNERQMNQIMRLIVDVYFKTNITIKKVLEYHRDAYFLNHIHRSVRFHASHHPVYFYQFSHSGNAGVEAELRVEKIGAAHSDELAYLFSEKGKDLGGDDGVVQRHLTTLWTNFVKYLTPTLRNSGETYWEAVDPHNLRLLNIGTELEMTDFPHLKAMSVWEDVYDKYYYESKLNMAG